MFVCSHNIVQYVILYGVLLVCFYSICGWDAVWTVPLSFTLQAEGFKEWAPYMSQGSGVSRGSTPPCCYPLVKVAKASLIILFLLIPFFATSVFLYSLYSCMSVNVFTYVIMDTTGTICMMVTY